jgi:hypothetical protein
MRLYGYSSMNGMERYDMRDLEFYSTRQCRILTAHREARGESQAITRLMTMCRADR